MRPRRSAASLPAVAVIVAVALGLGASRANAAPTPSSSLGARLARALAVANISPVRTAAVAIDLATGEQVYAQNGDRGLAPASNEKLAVTYAALVSLGPRFRMHTDVLGRGRRVAGTWEGDLVLQGHGDPTLSSGGLRRLARGVAASGIRRVTGAILGDESYFDSVRVVAGWRSSFYLNESPPLSALTVDRARYRGLVAERPALGAAAAFADALARAGVIVSGRSSTGVARAADVPLATLASPPLGRILAFMDRTSDNFTAELLLKQLGAVESSRGTSAAGASVVTQLLVAGGIPLTGVRIVDGSGLSTLDRLTVNALVGILRALYGSTALRPALMSALPVAGRSGTLEHRMVRPPLRGNVVAKTGTTREASALAGFVRNRYVFAILQNGSPLASWWARTAQDRFTAVLAGQ